MQNNPFIVIGLPMALFIIMFGMGLSLRAIDFRRVLEQPATVAVGTALQLLVIPILGFAIAAFYDQQLFAVGMVLIAVLPGGTTSNVLCYLAKSNLALSITLTLIASLVTIIAIPLYLNLALNLFIGDSQSVSLPVISTLLTMLIVIVIPVALGMLVKNYWPGFAVTTEKAISVFAVLFLIGIIAAIIVVERERLPGWLVTAWLPVTLLNLSALAVSFISGRIFRFSPDTILTLIIESGIKNTTLGLTIALTLLDSIELALPVAVYGLLMYLSAGLLTVIGRRYLKGTRSVTLNITSLSP